MQYFNNFKIRSGFIAIGLFLLVFALSGCGITEKPLMDELAADGKYHYKNHSLSFSIVLPKEFIYYQTQRKETEDWVDIEFFVPSSDTSYRQEVPGYAKPIIVRVFKRNAWEAVEQDEDFTMYKKIMEKEDQIYTIAKWKKVPADSQEKWSEELFNEIINNFSLN
ncbi:hypothetical protein K8R32_01270 [bacterium]|nr:hypothetical protein [bacterium]